jgi:UDP-glucose 4-epimerase
MRSKTVHVVVTGGAGFIGSHLVDALLARETTSVLVVDNLRRGRLINIAHHDGDPRFNFLLGDVREPDVLAEALRDADVVYHLAAQSNVMGAVSDPRYSFETNVMGTYNVLDAALRTGVRRVVFASSREAYGEARSVPVAEDHPLAAKNTYGASKLAGEAYCRTFTNVFGLQTAVLRFANVYGPRDFDRVIPIWIDRALNGEALEVYGGDQIIDFVWVGQAVSALLRAADADLGGEPVNVGSGTGTPIRDLAVRILAATDSRSELRVVAARQAEVARFVADVRRMRATLDLEPSADPLEYLPRLLSEAGTRTTPR